ncbi:MAG: PAS domain S-box protein [Chitinophagales bacterium]|nr:PAS domain S-box protein [Chitinophagales bacterium]
MRLLLSTDKIFVAVIALLLLSITAVLFISISESRQVNQAARMVDHTEQVLIHTERLLLAIKDNESASRGFTLTGEKLFLEHLATSKKAAEQELATLRSLTAGNDDQQNLLDTLSFHIAQRIDYSDKTIDVYHSTGADAAIDTVRTGKGRELSADVRRVIDSIRNVESLLLAKRKEINEERTARLNYILAITVIAILALAGFFIQKLRSDFAERKKTAIRLAHMNEELEERVEKRTHELAESKNVLEQTFERITDSFVSFDQNWNFTYVNKKAGEIFNRRPADLVGKNIWTEFPDAKQRPSYTALLQAMETQQYTYLETHHTEQDLWFENYIYPSPDGVSVFFRNISEKKRAEQQLKTSEEKTRLIMNSALDAIISIDEAGLITFWNPQAEQTFGWSAEEITGKSLTDTIIPPQYREMHQKGMELYRQTGKGPVLNKIIEISAVNRSGAEFPIELTIIPVRYNGSVSFSAFIRDISLRKKAEEKILKANRLYFFISQVNQMIVRATNQETLFKEACRIAVELGKFSLAWIGLVDEATESVVPVVYAGEENKYLSEIKPISIKDIPEGHGPTGQAIRNGQYYICNDIEADPAMDPWKDAALSRGYRSSMSLPIIKSGKVVGAFSFYAPVKNFFDDSEIALLEEATGDVAFALEVFEKEEMRRKAEQGIVESERRYHTLAEVSPVGIFHTDAAGSTTYVNPRWCQISGITYEKAMGNGWFEAVHPDDRDMLRRNWEEATRHQQVSVSEYRFVRPNGSTAWVIGQAIPERDADGAIVGYVGTTTDITDRKLAEKEMEESSQKLRQLTTHLLNIREEERKRIGREIHDELGQQLTAIKMDISWIAKKTDPSQEAFKTKLQNVIALLDGGNQSIRRILNELRPVILDDYGLLEALRWQAQQFTANTHIPVAMTASESDMRIPEEISTCIFRIFQEALTNITRYAKATQVKVSLDIDSDSVLLNIEDNGLGFDTELTKTKKSFGILGMKERVASLNGRFDLSSVPGNGTRISIHIPITQKTTDPVS